MNRLNVLVPHTSTNTEGGFPRLRRIEPEELIEEPVCRNRAARGAITGVLLGAGLWSIILVLAGVIKL